MAADRAAELTEAYRILSDAGRRADYDAQRAHDPGPSAAPPPVPGPGAEAPIPRQPPPPSAAQPDEAPPRASGGKPDSTGPQFKQEGASRDTFVRKATVDRFRAALAGAGEHYDEARVVGFDLAFLPKSTFFSKSKNPKLLGRFVAALDADAIADTWSQAVKWKGPSSDEVCVFLMASELAPPRLLAAAIAEQRRKPAKGGKVVLIPIDARNWEAHVPTDAPPIARTLLSRLRSAG